MPGELPLVLLALIAGRPQGGYELMGELERRFGPAYRPSPGSVYPRCLRFAPSSSSPRNPVSGKGAYRVTASGRRMLADQRDMLTRVESRTSAQLAPDVSLEPVVARFAARVSKFSGRVDRAAVERILDTAAKAIADLEVSSGQ